MNRKLSLALLLLTLLITTTTAFAQQTTIWLVRHAEKQTSDAASMTSTDPELTKDGEWRAVDLAAKLKRYPIAVIYTTNYKRTQATGTPLANKLKINKVVYDAKDLPAIAAKALQENQGKQVLIVDTLIPSFRLLKLLKPKCLLTS